jgi:hypothetical protein
MSLPNTRKKRGIEHDQSSKSQCDHGSHVDFARKGSWRPCVASTTTRTTRRALRLRLSGVTSRHIGEGIVRVRPGLFWIVCAKGWPEIFSGECPSGRAGTGSGDARAPATFTCKTDVSPYVSICTSICASSFIIIWSQ